LLIQAVGVVVCFIWAFGVSYVLFHVVKATVGLRVSEAEERQGLDISEHGETAYANFQVFESAHHGL